MQLIDKANLLYKSVPLLHKHCLFLSLVNFQKMISIMFDAQRQILKVHSLNN